LLSAGIGTSLAKLNQPEEDPASDLLLFLAQGN
jgi:hypothetical protein